MDHKPTNNKARPNQIFQNQNTPHHLPRELPQHPKQLPRPPPPHGFVKVTYLGIRSAHECVWLVEEKPIWLPRAYLTRGDLEPARGNVHVCKLVRELTNIQIRTVTAETPKHSKCICLTNALQLNEGRKEGRRTREREGTATERGRERSTQYALKPTIVVSVGLIQESVSYCLLRPLWTTSYFGNHGL